MFVLFQKQGKIKMELVKTTSCNTIGFIAQLESQSLIQDIHGTTLKYFKIKVCLVSILPWFLLSVSPNAINFYGIQIFNLTSHFVTVLVTYSLLR